MDGSGGTTGVAIPTSNVTYAPSSPVVDESANQMLGISPTETGEPQPQRVYVVESDINEVGQQVKVKESEASF